MTPEQLHNNVFLFTSVGGALLVETVGWLRAPGRLAAVAFAPLFTRRIALGPRTRAALSTPDGRASYRAAALGDVDWSRLAGPRRFERQGVRFELDAAGARLVARLPPTPLWFALGGVAVLRLRVEGDAVVVVGRALPWLSLTSAAFFVALLALVGPHGPPAIAALFVGLLAAFNGLGAWRTRRVFAPPVWAGVDELAARVAP